MFAKVNCYTSRRPTDPVLSIFVGPSSSALPVASPGMGHWGTYPPWSLMHAVFFLLPGAFCGLKYAENAIAAGALPGPRWGSSRRSPRPPSRLGSGHPSTYPTHSAPRCSRLRRLDRRAPLTPNPGDATVHCLPIPAQFSRLNHAVDQTVSWKSTSKLSREVIIFLQIPEFPSSTM